MLFFFFFVCVYLKNKEGRKLISVLLVLHYKESFVSSFYQNENMKYLKVYSIFYL